MTYLPRVGRLLIVCGVMLMASACTTSSEPPEKSAYGRQDDAMKHPFDYSPDMDNPNISGGGIGDFDPKAFNKDLNHVLDP